jgi:hypothetical protein
MQVAGSSLPRCRSRALQLALAAPLRRRFFEMGGSCIEFHCEVQGHEARDEQLSQHITTVGQCGAVKAES